MGNCQAIDAATLAIQHPSGKVENLYWPVSASEVMKTNPGHYVALLLSTTLYPPSNTTENNNPVRITRIKLLRPTDTLSLGHAYRLITTQEVMKGLWAKKQAKLKKKEAEAEAEAETETEEKDVIRVKEKQGSGLDRRSELEKENQVTKNYRAIRTATTTTSANSGIGIGRGRSRGWQPSLRSISEAT